jgi:hypothetical protein
MLWTHNACYYGAAALSTIRERKVANDTRSGNVSRTIARGRMERHIASMMLGHRPHGSLFG